MRPFMHKISAAIVIATASLAAHAVDGTVTITGTVSATTCTVSVNGGSASNTVTLPTIGASALVGSGAVAGATAFSIGVSGCTTSQSSMAPYFEAAGSSAFNGGRLATGVSGVDIQILTSTGGVVNLSGSAAVASGQTGQGVPVVPLSGANPSKSATSNFVARYYSNAASVGTGAVSVALAYTITYQ
ncbi:MAG: type 1 fimbrial protein [Pelomonas sp.]|nr:type 1 fimbrial protein [Roseateles sp.]